MNNLNELLKAKAEKRLEKELEEYIRTFRENKFFQAIAQMSIKHSETNESLSHFFWDSNRKAGQLMKEKFLADYIETEAKCFMAKVEELQEQIDELKTT
jgi:hypothetical protein